MLAKRPNSGRKATYERCEDHRQIDIRRLARDGWLHGHHAMRWGWSSGAWIDLRTGPDVVAVAYRYRRNGGDWVSVDQAISIVRTSVGYGSRGRPWFACPVCRRRCAILYLVAGPVCRLCGDLRYASQSDGETNRSWGRTYKIEAKLSDDAQWNFQKPRYMHWKTFNKLCEAHSRESALRDAQLAAWLYKYDRL